MAHDSRLNYDSSAVQKHLDIVQGVITRMSVNSRSCKVWCVTLVSAVLVLVARTEQPDYAFIALIPAVLFLILDTYYMALEKGFRNSYESFVGKIHLGELTPSDLYPVAPCGSNLERVTTSLRSFSIWPFYPTIVAMILLAWWLVFE